MSTPDVTAPEVVRENPGASPDYVQSLARGLSVIKAFGAHAQRQSLSDVARATGLTRATARRFLLTLIELGYVRTDGSQFWLTPRVLELGYSYLSALTLPESRDPISRRSPRKSRNRPRCRCSTAPTSSTSHEFPSAAS